MGRINLLNEDTSNKIAAGEVVERPSSVVKELIENSIDAKASVINIEIEEGGQKLIKVSDDGTGINPEDIELAFMPHATSKISSIEDIYAINTLGFRGEALPSIAAVSNVVLRSRMEGNEIGKEISINGGVKEYVKEIGCSIGTTTEVKNIFFNVPARQKFLKSTQREASIITDIVNRLALSNPKISFRLINNGKKVVNTYSTESLFNTIRTIYGKSIGDNVIKFEKHTDIASVYGYVGNAEISRGSRNNQSVFVNNRYIKNKLIATAVETAVKSFMMINKYPFFALFLDIFPEYIDVNVHPTKAEVKFENDRELFKLVFDAVHEAIRNSLKNNFELELESPIQQEIEGNTFKRESIQMPLDLKTDNENTVSINDFHRGQMASSNNFVKETNDVAKDYSAFIEDKVNKQQLEKPTDISSASTPKFPALRIIGQFHNTYILAESAEDFYIIDQHAAHEKILFEKYTKDIKQSHVTAQILLMPEVIELTPEDFIYYVENKEIFQGAGFSIEEFGDNTINIREVPNFLGKPELRNIFSEILDNLKKLGSGETYEVKYKKIATLACKAAIKANDNLNIEEMKVLIENLRLIDDPFNCPHGRPTIIKTTLYEMEKKFKRVQ
ncbi:DNA mismatch repair endonuclease MutL [Clostridium akagii]|uniref:DNA mismatch repair endonuclease MutL n=1 Tax=Clostridium akagii TaxID=91623 RepID=UPI00047DF0F4|nr:DNA mismatch repair endonuclease MutL [Clostridium akagii]